MRGFTHFFSIVVASWSSLALAETPIKVFEKTSPIWQEKLTLTFPIREIPAETEVGALLCSSKPHAFFSISFERNIGGSLQRGDLSKAKVNDNCVQISQLKLANDSSNTLLVDLNSGDKVEFPIPVAQSALAYTYISQAGNEGFATLQLVSKPVSTASTSGWICTNEGSALKKAELFMPHHGHGSSPTDISETTSTCSYVSQMEFYMKGKWEVRSTLANGSKFVFSLNVLQ